MRHLLSPAQSRALAMLLLVLVVVATVAAIAIPTRLLHQRYDAYLEDHTDRLARYRRVAALRPAIEKELKEVESRAGRQYYLKSASAASSAAELQGLVTSIVEASKGKVTGSQAIPAKEDGKASGPAKTTISVQMNASIVSLLTILHTLETTRPYLFIDQLSVRAAQGRTYRPVAGVEPEYAVQIRVSGFSLAASGKP